MYSFFIFFGSLSLAVVANPAVHEWISFKQLNAKNYESPDEEMARYKLYSENKKMIEEHNEKYELGLVSYKMKMNEFGDMEDDEFIALLLDTNMTSGSLRTSRLGASSFIPRANPADLPTSVDWREEGALTPVKNQENCGACWAFAATGAIEAQTYLKTGKLIPLSEQNLMDCSSFNSYSNNGCLGGLMNNAFKYIIDQGGIDTQESYPYEKMVSKCRFNPRFIGATIRDYFDIGEGDEKGMAEAVANVGPVAVGIDAKMRSFRFYHEGVYYEDGCADNGVNHAVLVIGYGVDVGKDYWLVRNSWGTKWGDKGHIKMARNKDNHCGITTIASFPVL